MPHTVHEIEAILSTMERGEGYAKVNWSFSKTQTNSHKGPSGVSGQHDRGKEGGARECPVPGKKTLAGSCSAAQS